MLGALKPFGPTTDRRLHGKCLLAGAVGMAAGL